MFELPALRVRDTSEKRLTWAALRVANEIGDGRLALGSADATRRDLYESIVNRLSHELGGPLAVLRGYLSLWLEGTLDPQPWCSLAEIETCAETVDSLIKEVGLIVASVDAQVLSGSPPDLDHWVADLGSSLAGQMVDLRHWFQGRDRNEALRMSFASAHAALVCERSAILLQALVKQLEAMQAAYGESVPQLTRIELADWVRRTMHDIAPVITCFGHKVTVDFPPQPVVIMVNPELLAVALVNVLDNAQKYSAPQTRIRLTVFRSTTVAGFSVEDEGPGLPREFSLRMFGRIDEGRGFAAPGLGLGLYIASQVAKLFGGGLTLQSIERIGTTVRIELPLAPEGA